MVSKTENRKKVKNVILVRINNQHEFHCVQLLLIYQATANCKTAFFSSLDLWSHS